MLSAGWSCSPAPGSKGFVQFNVPPTRRAISPVAGAARYSISMAFQPLARLYHWEIRPRLYQPMRPCAPAGAIVHEGTRRDTKIRRIALAGAAALLHLHLEDWRLPGCSRGAAWGPGCRSRIDPRRASWFGQAGQHANPFLSACSRRKVSPPAPALWGLMPPLRDRLAGPNRLARLYIGKTVGRETTSEKYEGNIPYDKILFTN